MNTSVIRYRVADFLKRHAPFDSIPESDLLTLAATGRVKFHECDEYIHRHGQAKTPFVWVIQQGRVELILERNDDRQLLDVMGDGDILGLDRFIGDGAYKTSAVTTSDTILYAIEARAFEDLMARHPDVEHYLAAHFSLSSSASAKPSWLDAAPPPITFLAHRPKQSAPHLPSLPEAFTTRDAVRTLMAHRTLAAHVSGATLSAADLALFTGANPAQLLHDIHHARAAAELNPLLQLANRQVLDALSRPSDVDDCARMATEFVAAATAACIRLAEQDAADAGIARPDARYAWFAYGTLARGEVLRLQPPKVGVVFDDAPLGDPTAASIYGTVVAGRLSDWLHKCGLNGPEAQWPQGSHPCMPRSEWKHFFGSTIRNPIGHDLFARREFFDLRPLSGDASLIDELQSWLLAQRQQSDLLVPLLANDTLGNLPPLTFFSGLVVALDGTEHKDLDLAATALHPISDAARVFALADGHPQVGTLERLAAAGDNPVFHDAAEAYRIALYQQALAGSNRIDPSKLERLDQRLLKTAFSSVLRLLEHTTRRFFNE
jgi:signal-transduction protein with cAMP-binding, CBS, and nucleotidyltransferase domain